MAEKRLAKLSSNPFPATAVEPERLDPAQFLARNARTAPVKALEDFLTGYDSGDYDGCVVGIRGDYGTGKTHLLKLAEHHFGRRNREESPVGATNRASNRDNFLISTNSTGTDFHEYAQQQIFSNFTADELKDLVLRFLAEVARADADRLSLTRKAVEVLEKDYRKVRDLLNADLLPATRILDTARERLGSLSKQDVLGTVFSAMADPARSGPACRWVTLGSEVKKEDLQRLRVHRRIDNDEMALAVVRLLAGLFEEIGMRWVVLLDQFEHLMRRERVDRTEHIQAAFKELSVIMGRGGHALIIAGHLHAWRVRDDFYGRFLLPIIDIPSLRSGDIRKVLNVYLGVGERDPAPHLVSALKTESRGNLRTLLLICNRLYKSLTHKESFLEARPKSVTKAYNDIRFVRTKDELIDGVSRRLQDLATPYEANVTVARWRVDLAVPDRKQPDVLVKCITATEEGSEVEEVRAVLNHALLVRESHSDVQVLLLLTGYVTRKLLDQLHDAGLEALDATDRAFDQYLDQKVLGIAQQVTIPTPYGGAHSVDEATIQAVLERLRDETDRREAQILDRSRRISKLDDQSLEGEIRNLQGEEQEHKVDALRGTEMLRPFRRLRYIGLLPKLGVTVFGGLVFIFLGYIVLGLDQWTFFQTEVWNFFFFRGDVWIWGLVMSAVLFYVDWRAADLLVDAVLFRRRQDLLGDRDLYLIFKREEEMHELLTSRWLLGLWPARKRLKALIREGGEPPVDPTAAPPQRS